MLRSMEYSLQGNRKTEEGNNHPDRDAQFRSHQRAGAPGSGRRSPRHIGGHEEEGTDRQLRKRGPTVAYGEIAPDGQRPRLSSARRSRGPIPMGSTTWVATAGSSTWAPITTPARSPSPRFEDGGVSKGDGCIRRRAELFDHRGWWRQQRVSPATVEDRTPECSRTTRGCRLSVCHFPPGTSKWNKVEHRLFSFISSNWRGEPLRDYETVVRLIAGTTTARGLKVTCRLDRRRYPVGRKVSDEEFAKVNLKTDPFHGEWNYTIRPRRKPSPSD